MIGALGGRLKASMKSSLLSTWGSGSPTGPTESGDPAANTLSSCSCNDKVGWGDIVSVREAACLVASAENWKAQQVSSEGCPAG